MNFNWHLTGNKKPHSSGFQDFLGLCWMLLELVEAASIEN